jgi:hypothetical protein
MNTHRNPDTDRADGAFMRFYDWVNEKLFPLLGPADLSPYEPALEQSTSALCPLCKHPMGEHYFDRSAADVILHCPADEVPNSDSGKPLNEWGRVER